MGGSDLDRARREEHGSDDREDGDPDERREPRRGEQARALLAAGSSTDASTMIERGLALGEHADVFTANLLTTRGRIHEARGDDHQAARDYHRALTIQETLLERALSD